MGSIFCRAGQTGNDEKIARVAHQLGHGFTAIQVAQLTQHGRGTGAKDIICHIAFLV
jgi:hypothetical protein